MWVQGVQAPMKFLGAIAQPEVGRREEGYLNFSSSTLAILKGKLFAQCSVCELCSVRVGYIVNCCQSKRGVCVCCGKFFLLCSS